MKHIITLILFSLVLSSCSNKNNGLTEKGALENIKACNAQIPIQVIKGIYIGKMVYNHSGSSLKYLKLLAKKGVIQLDSISSSKQELSSHTRINTVYNNTIPEKHKQYITKQKGDIVYVKFAYREAISVQKITLNNEFRADVEVKFKKVKTPFYHEEFDTNFQLKDKPEEYIETISFSKSKTQGWTSCFLKTK